MELSVAKKAYLWVGGLRRLCGIGYAGYVVGCAGFVVRVAQAMWWSVLENNATLWLHLAS